MEKLDIDTLGLYAYADAANARERELWRGFLSYALPVVMSMSPKAIDQCLSEAVVYHMEELTARGDASAPPTESIRCISIILAKEIGVSPEFALAAFFEGELPTKLFRMKVQSKKKSAKLKAEDNVIANWLLQVSKLQTDNKFLNQVEKWKIWLGDLLEAKAS
jgi:hypothetical protein